MYVVKIVDQDGNPATDEDETFPGGWHYLVTVGGGTADPNEVVTDEETLAFTTITLDDGSATVSLKEVVQAGYDLLDAVCIQEPASEVDLHALRADRLKIMQDEGIGVLEGDTLTFEVPADTITLCGFLNQPEKATPSGGVEGATGTPKLTRRRPTPSARARRAARPATHGGSCSSRWPACGHHPGADARDEEGPQGVILSPPTAGRPLTP